MSAQQDDLTDLSGRVAVVTGAAAGLGRAEAIGLARSGATIVVNDMAAALDKSDVLDAIVAAGSKAVAVEGDISSAKHRRRTRRHRRRSRWAPYRRQQRWYHPRQDAVQHVRRRLGRRHRRAPARALPADPQRGDVLARQGKGRRRQPTGAGLRPDHQHVVGGRAHRPCRPGQLRRRQGRHHPR